MTTELEEEQSSRNRNHEMREIFSEFVSEVAKFEELVSLGRRYLAGFQQAMEFLRRPPIPESSELVQSIIKSNQTRRLKSYVDAGCFNADDSKQRITELNVSLTGLQDHLLKSKGVIGELEKLMEKAGNAMRADDGRLEDELEEKSVGEFGSFMAVIYSMVKQDYAMQERIVCDLGMKSSAGELDGYAMMWSLRPFVDDVVILQALGRLQK